MKRAHREELLDDVYQSKVRLCRRFFDEDKEEFLKARLALALEYSLSDEPLEDLLSKENTWYCVFVNVLIMITVSHLKNHHQDLSAQRRDHVL